ncbi:MAG: hypothetical protein RJA70_2380 [Pseudomonadota bacterium]|jgi:8-oxo-dGTP pyrophosphatase MutT (NUDIX family)
MPRPVRHPEIRVFDCHVARESDGVFEFLLLKRAQGRIYSGDWRMVGGKIEPNETAWQACLRELKEETQLTPVRLFSVPFISRFYEWQQDRINDIPVFLAFTTGEQPILDHEHVDAEWLSSERAIQRLTWPGQIGGLQAAEALLRHPSPLLSHLEIDPALLRGAN